jgi:MFS family permease
VKLGRAAAFAAAAYAFTITMLGTTLPTPLYVLYRHRFGFSELMITVIFATYAAGVIVALVLFGGLSDEVGRRRVLAAGLAFAALSSGAFLLAGGLAMLLVGRVLSGLSAGIFTGTATATLVDLAPGGDSGRATLVATVANMGGLGCGPLVAGLLAQWATLPLRLPFWVDIGLVLGAAGGVWAMPEPGSVSERPRLRPQALSVPREVRGTFVRAALAGFAGFAVMGLFTAVSPAFLGQELKIDSHAVVGLLVFAVFTASAAGQALQSKVPEALALSGGCGILIAGMGVVAGGLGAKSLALLVLGGVIAGCGQGLSFRAALAAVNEAAPESQRAEVASSFFVVAYVAISLPIIGEGVLAEVAGLEVAGLVFTAVVSAIAATAVVLLIRGD